MEQPDVDASCSRTVMRALAVLDCLAENRTPLSVLQVSQAIGVSRSTAYRLLRTLQTAGYVCDSASAPDKFQFGPKVLRLATVFIDSLGLRDVARPHLIKLRDLSGETVHLVIPHAGDVVYIDKVETLLSVRMHSVVGGISPMYCTAVGKAILAFLPGSEVDAIVQRGLPRRTPNTIVDAQALKEHLAQVRAQGFAIDEIENEDGIRCVGAPVCNHLGLPIAAISISGPAYRLSLEHCLSLADALKQTAAAVLRPA
jgi:IclR family transcriptional regulator, KDG regulon repressor